MTKKEAASIEAKFHDAITLVIACRANLNCGVSMSEDDKLYADWLYYQCKRYCENYLKFKENQGIVPR